jgi:ADP-heptose:LPS heptosyltransferase
MKPQRIIISRTDSIGDVILTLSVLGILKEHFPNSYLLFLGSDYTKDIISCCEHVDEFLDWTAISKLSKEEAISFVKSMNADAIIHVFPRKEIAALAKKANIKIRVGTRNRIFHWTTCNKLVKLSRKNSELHESQLNTKLLSPFGINKLFNLSEIITYNGFHEKVLLPEKYSSLIDKEKFNLILHPKSKGSAREWGLENFGKLIEILPPEKYKIFISGTKDEAALMQAEILDKYKDITDLTGKLTLAEFISFIAKADGLIAASTGPLHIAAALNKHAIGIYPPIKPMYPKRWKPIGKNAHYFVKDKICNDCRKLNECECMKSITPGEIKEYLENLPISLI